MVALGEIVRHDEIGKGSNVFTSKDTGTSHAKRPSEEGQSPYSITREPSELWGPQTSRPKYLP